MIARQPRNLPEFFERLMELQCFSGAEVSATSDGFYVAAVAIADILAYRGIATIPCCQGEDQNVHSSYQAVIRASL